MIAGIVLAAGRGERFGDDKLLQDLHGRPLVAHTIGNCLAPSLDLLVLVTREPGNRVEAVVRELFGGEPRLVIVDNPAASRGHMTSVKTGLRALPPVAGAAVVFLGDMPLVAPRITESLLACYRREGGFVVPCCGNAWQHPRLIPASHFPDFLALPDDAGGGSVFQRFQNEVRTVAVGEPWNYLDVDTAGDIAEAERHMRM